MKDARLAICPCFFSTWRKKNKNYASEKAAKKKKQETLGLMSHPISLWRRRGQQRFHVTFFECRVSDEVIQVESYSSEGQNKNTVMWRGAVCVRVCVCTAVLRRWSPLEINPCKQNFTTNSALRYTHPSLLTLMSYAHVELSRYHQPAQCAEAWTNSEVLQT